VLQGLLLLAAVGLGLLAGVDPKLGVAAALGLGFVTAVLADLSVGIALFAGVSFLDLLPFGGGAASFAKVLGALLLVSWIAALGRREEGTRDFVSDHPVLTYLLLLFLAWGALSLLWAEDFNSGVGALERYALNILLFVIAFSAVRESKHAVWVVTVFLVGATVSAMYGLLSPQSGSFEEVSRLAGSGQDPNLLAATLVSALALSTAFLVGWRHSPIVRVLALSMIALCAGSIFLSLSRGGLVALGVALVAGVVVGGRWRPVAATLLVAVGLAGVGYFTFLASPQAVQRVLETQGGTGRSDIWAVGWRMVKSSPTNGIGVGNFQVSSIHFLLEPGALQRDEFIVDEPKVAHNMYLEVLAELGVVGLALFVAVLGFSIACVAGAIRQFAKTGDSRMEALSRALMVAIISLLSANFFISAQFSKQLWLLLALGPALLALAREAQPRPVSSA
jgi:O-antigen ligase